VLPTSTDELIASYQRFNGTPGGPDEVDRSVAAWNAAHPDLDVGVMAEIERMQRVALLIQRRRDELGAELGVNRGEAEVLLALRRAGEPYRLSPSALAGALLVTSGTMTNRLDRLESKELVRRLPNPEDRRGLAVELTAAGSALLDAALEKQADVLHELMDGLTTKEQATLDRLMRKLLTHLVAPEKGAKAA
jgi:DNA-binding MarR family transcriptional regulator